MYHPFLAEILRWDMGVQNLYLWPPSGALLLLIPRTAENGHLANTQSVRLQLNVVQCNILLELKETLFSPSHCIYYISRNYPEQQLNFLPYRKAYSIASEQASLVREVQLCLPTFCLSPPALKAAISLRPHREKSACLYPGLCQLVLFNIICLLLKFPELLFELW